LTGFEHAGAGCDDMVVIVVAVPVHPVSVAQAVVTHDIVVLVGLAVTGVQNAVH
jgi:hypothetical protein